MFRAHNFSAGPAVLPLEVLEEVQKDLVSYKGKGLSIMEMSHRSADYQAVIDDASQRMKKIMNLDDDYEILFLQGGASLQFLMIPLNLCPNDKVANYVDTGTWSSTAIKEAKKIGKKVEVVASSADKDFTYIPRNIKVSDNAAYLHITTNNTIRGTQFKYIPEVKVPLIADMSSDFLSRPMDFNKFDLIYAGAQKNLGPAGVTIVVIRKSLMEKACKDTIPTMLDYNTHISKGSMHNTPPTFSIYVVGLVLKWLENLGGLKAIEKINIEKAKLIYDVLDSSSFYKGTAVKEDRSLMNIPFMLASEELEKKFLDESKKEGMSNLKGHRSVGGCRASIYNAIPLSSVKYLIDFMKKFEKENK